MARRLARQGKHDIALADHPAAGKLDNAVALLFAVGKRPRASDLVAQSLKQGQFAVTLESDPAELARNPAARQWVELLANGLTFDLSGLAPGPGEDCASGAHFYGFDKDSVPTRYEVLRLIPGPHLVSGGPMIPVIRCLAWLAAELATMDDVRAVMWNPARAVSAPGYFRESVTRWLGGGAFPGLGLTALVPQDDGTIRSEGLALFTGQELQLERQIAQDRAQGAKLAIRLLHWMVDSGRIDHTQSLIGPTGEPLLLEPDFEHALVHVRSGSR